MGNIENFMVKNKLALCMIVKGSDSEAERLERCLDNVSQFVDGIFITITHLHGEKVNQVVWNVCSKYKAVVSGFEWTNDFAEARNFNFSGVPKEYDYILWCDSDDVFRNLNKLKPIIVENPMVDAFAFWYLYEFDEYRTPIVVHKKTQVVRNDGCVSWIGKLHEDFKENRAINVKFVEGIERMHFTTDERSAESRERNVTISKAEAKHNPDDPKVYFNLANSLFGAGKNKEARRAYLKFIETSGSDDEKYVAYQRLSAVDDALGNREESIQDLLIS